MNKQQFITLLENPEKLDTRSLNDLKELLAEYPSFQCGHVMYLKNLFELEDIRYEKYLPKIAVYAGNRELLYNYIINEPIKKPNPAEVEAYSSDQALKGEENIPGKPLQVPGTEIQTGEPERKQPPAGDRYFGSSSLSNDYFSLGSWQPVEDQMNQDSVHSFAQWLDIMNRTKSEHKEVSAPVRDKNWKLIDEFISEKPQLSQSTGSKHIDTGSDTDLSARSVSENDEFMTETLARIYLKQKSYDKAIHIFKKLSLKYPEKSIYFAGQIKIVEQLKNNEK